MRLGLFGGSFDPVHCGHVGLAATARAALALDEILFIPAFHSPHKPNSPIASIEHRVAMLQLAIAGHASFALSRIEADAGHAAFTIDTVRALRRTYGPTVAWVLLLGWDAWIDFPRWREAEALRQLVDIAVAPRPGLESAALDGAQLIPAPAVAISSSAIRARLAHGEAVDGLVPDDVAAYITRHGLYRDA